MSNPWKSGDYVAINKSTEEDHNFGPNGLKEAQQYAKDYGPYGITYVVLVVSAEDGHYDI